MSSTTPINEPSICIPRVFDNIEKKVIWGVFTELFGRDAIDRIDVVFKETPNGDKYKRVFVHFRAWPTTYESQLVRRKLMNGEEVKIVYDEPWFWKCSASRIEKPATRERPVVRPYVDISPSRDQRVRERDEPSRSSNFRERSEANVTMTRGDRRERDGAYADRSSNFRERRERDGAYAESRSSNFRQRDEANVTMTRGSFRDQRRQPVLSQFVPRQVKMNQTPSQAKDSEEEPEIKSKTAAAE